MDIAFEHEIHFSNRERLLLIDVAKSLLALDRNAKAAPLALEKLCSDVKLAGIDLYIDELRAGSLKEKIKFNLRLALQRQIEVRSGLQLGEMSEQPKERQEQIAAWLITAMILIGLKMGAEAIRPGVEKPHLENNIKISLSAGSKITSIDPEVLNEAIVSSLQETRGTVNGAVEFARPAKKDSKAWIHVNNVAFMSPEALAEIPSATVEIENEKVLDLPDTQILIRATDRDSPKRGWGATIPAFSESRMRVTVAPGIDLSKLALQDVVTGNVTIFYTTDNAGNVTRRHAHIYAITYKNERAGDPIE